jgi:enamine deaminase RidA (YjgF/YER057c/UK114 family)
MIHDSLMARRSVGNPAASAGNSRLETPLSTWENYSELDLAEAARCVLMITPRGRGDFREQGREVLEVMRLILEKRRYPAAITVQTVFLRDAGDQRECASLFAEHYGAGMPVTHFVAQPPGCGAALAIEAWAIGGRSVHFERHGPQTVAVSYEGLRWVHYGGFVPPNAAQGLYAGANQGFQQMRQALARAGSRFEQVVRTWFYLGGITEPESQTSRYQELNRARKDFYRDIPFTRSLATRNGKHAVYPASTGIGMDGTGLVMSCLALETRREDVFLLPLENPQQTPAYAYPVSRASQSPKFSRAMALVAGDFVTTWISGTASILNSESCHPGDIEGQTEETIANIERLIEGKNFMAHGLSGAGAGLSDLAKVRVYVKRWEDLERCRAICERRFGRVPALYLVADVCRPELLVEIEGVAFSKVKGSRSSFRNKGP